MSNSPVFWAAALIVKSKNVAQKVNFIGYYSSRRRSTEAKTRFRNGGMALAHIPATVDRNRLPGHVVIRRQHHSDGCDVVHRAKMPHRNKIRVRVGVAGHHIGLYQRGSNGVHGDPVSKER